MNSRRLMGAPPQGGGRTLPHRCVRTLLCTTAKLIVEWQRGVNLATSGRGDASIYVRYVSNSEQGCESQRSAEMCQKRTLAPQQNCVIQSPRQRASSGQRPSEAARFGC